MMARLRRGLRRLRHGPPVPPVPPVAGWADQLPEPPIHDPRYHELAGRLTAARGRAWAIDHEAYARAEARSITEVPPAPDRETRPWEATDEGARERGRDARGGGGYLCESMSPL